VRVGIGGHGNHEDGALHLQLANSLLASSDEDAAAVLVGLVEQMRVGTIALLMDMLPPTRELDYARHPIRLLVSSEEVDVRLLSVEKEPFTVEWIESSIRPGDVFYDIGANVGSYSLIAAKATANGARIFAFEPSAGPFYDLARNVLLNGCAESIVPLPLALGSSNGPLEVARRASDEAGSFPVVSIRIDDLVERFGLPVPTHAKIDTDGHELGVLLGAERTLLRPEWTSVIIELDRGETGRNKAIKSVLADAGFDTGVEHGRVATPNFPRPAGRPDVYWTFTRTPPRKRRSSRAAWSSRPRSTPLRAAQRRAVTATLAMVLFLFLLFVFLPEQLGDRPYDVLGLRF